MIRLAFVYTTHHFARSGHKHLWYFQREAVQFKASNFTQEINNIIILRISS